MMKTEVKVNSSLAKRNFQKFIKNKLAIVGAVGVVVIVLLCICAPLLTNYDPSLIDPVSRSLPPSAMHPLGTDRLGRDLLARVLYGGRTSIMLGVAAAISPVTFIMENIIDIIILIIMSTVVWIFAWTSKKINRKEGIIMLLVYVVYMVYICIR